MEQFKFDESKNQNDYLNQSDALNNGFASFLNRVYVLTGLGLLISFFVARYLGIRFLLSIINSDNFQFLMFLPFIITLVLTLFIGKAVKSASPNVTVALYLIFVFVYGLGLGSIFITYEIGSIIFTFVVTSISFFGLSAYGFITKRDLSKFGKFLHMGLWGLIGIGLLSLFGIRFGALEIASSFLGVFIFAGLIIYDTNKMKDLYSFSVSNGDNRITQYSVLSALQLFLDFMGLFLYLLRILGRRK